MFIKLAQCFLYILGGPIPKELGRLVNLWELQLQDNILINGYIPKEIGNMKSLSYLRLCNNTLTGIIFSLSLLYAPQSYIKYSLHPAIVESYLVMTRVLRNIKKSKLIKLVKYESHLYILVL